MVKKFKIEIPETCNQDWNLLTKTRQGAFCQSCNKEVIDFTEFTDFDLKKFYLSHPNERICGKFLNSQLDKTLEIDSKSCHSTLLKIGSLLVGIYSLFSFHNLSAQNKPNTTKTTINKTKHTRATPKIKSKSQTRKPKFILIRGQVRGIPTRDVTIELLGTPYKISPTFRGDFEFTVIEDILKNHCVLEIKAPHYETKEVYVNSCNAELGPIMLEMIPFEVIAYKSQKMGAMAITCVESKPTFIQRIKRIFKKHE